MSEQIDKAKIMVAWTAGWILRQAIAAAAMALGAYTALIAIGVKLGG